MSWLDRHARLSKRFAVEIARIGSIQRINRLAESFQLGWDTVKSARWLQQRHREDIAGREGRFDWMNHSKPTAQG